VTLYNLGPHINFVGFVGCVGYWPCDSRCGEKEKHEKTFS